ncbi:MAG: alanine racemase [Actinomycetota bacterium]|nr:alanine racemase [Actinomycetota bacterium]
MAEGSRRPARVEVDLGAISENAAVLARIAAPAELCAVVKADAYGHGAVPVAAAALRGGASELAVALVDEGVELREAGITAPILVLSEPGREAMAEAFARRLTPTIYTPDGVALARHAAGARGGGPWPVEVKVDTGMHRVGVAPSDAPGLVAAVASSGVLAFGGLWTHFALADEVDDDFTELQIERFLGVRKALADAGLPDPGRLHAANSAGAIAWPAARFDLVRCGIALYGYSPGRAVTPRLEAAGAHLRRALSWKARVTYVQRLGVGEAVSYGLRSPLEVPSNVATVPLGYGDGIPRAYFERGGEVLVNGRARHLAGTVTMDQIMVDCSGDDVRPGDEVVLIGSQGDARLTADDWADRLGTISYEIITRIGARVPRVHLP